MSVSLDTKVRMPRGIVPDAVGETGESPVRLALTAKCSRRLVSDCEHRQLVSDDINDVYCQHCGEDFTD